MLHGCLIGAGENPCKHRENLPGFKPENLLLSGDSAKHRNNVPPLSANYGIKGKEHLDLAVKEAKERISVDLITNGSWIK